MDGAGVTNYSVDKPTYGYTTGTTQFDDALMQHGVITRTQALVAKGATVCQAQALLQAERQTKEAWNEIQVRHWNDNDDDKEHASDSEGDDSDDDDSYNDLLDDADDEVLQRYRQLRLDEFKEASQNNSRQRRGTVESISRDEWTTKVNEASRDGTAVIICLTTSSARQDFLQACTVLSKRHSNCIFVTLPATEALGLDWPHPEPSLLVYRHGKLQHEFFRLTNVSVTALEDALRKVWQDE